LGLLSVNELAAIEFDGLCVMWVWWAALAISDHSCKKGNEKGGDQAYLYIVFHGQQLAGQAGGERSEGRGRI
jgi:hypothetical protein